MIMEADKFQDLDPGKLMLSSKSKCQHAVDPGKTNLSV